jgi:membrane protease YdiL (CAAX protease family)
MLDLTDAPRALLDEMAAAGPAPAVRNLLLNWVPHVTLTALGCWVFLHFARGMPRTALALRLGRRDAYALPIGIVLLLVYQLMLRMWVQGGPPGDTPAAEATSAAFVALYVLRFLPSALAEEMVFRAGLFGGIATRYGAVLGVTCSLALFGAAHAYGAEWLLINALVLGAGFTAAYAWTRNLVTVTLLHAFSNVVYAYLNYRAA